PDKKGIVKAVSGFLYDIDTTILEAAQHGDTISNRFFLRMEFTADSDQLDLNLDNIRESFAKIAAEFSMDWEIHDASRHVKAVIAVSRSGHCLNDVLHRWQAGILPIDIVCVVSNHPDMQELVEWYGLPFHHVPVTDKNKREQEQRVLALMLENGAELLLLARYMQILSDGMCNALDGQGMAAINIHHSFLPGFKGAKPYHQAYARGVKIIGATSHYVTPDLDEGPIIEQCVERIDHQCTPEELMQIGRDTECLAFARAIKWHCEHRVITNGKRTVVFK
ncbi:MAG: formyltetrahydrofolate deformylase, partial [Gammaproteobacteria bacterium]